MLTPGTTSDSPVAPGSDRATAKPALLRALPWMVLAAALCGTYLLWNHTRENAMRALQAEFEYGIREASDHVELRMATYGQVLRGLQGLFSASQEVKRDEFRNFVARLHLDQNYPGAQGMGFAQLVPPEQKNRHIAGIRSQGFPNYTLHPEGERETYTAVVYIEPFNERNQRAFGYDMYSDLEQPRAGDSAPGLRRAAMERARDSGEAALSGKAAISGKVRLLMEKDTDPQPQAGVLMYLPVYRNGAPVDTVAERRASLVGWVYAPFRMDDLMGGILAEHGGEIDIEIYDGEEISERTLLYDDDKIRRADNKAGARFQASQHIEVSGRTWTMVITSLPPLEMRLDQGASLKVALAGIAVSLLLALLTLLGVHDRHLALEIARQISESRARINLLNEQLTLALKELESIMNAFPDLHYLINMDGKLIRWNSSFEKFTGLAHEALPNRQLLEFICEEDRLATKEGMRQILGKGHYSSEVRYIRHDGAPVPFLCNGAIAKHQNGELIGILVACRDISERKTTEERMQHLAHYDLLTGLPNRTLFSDRLQLALATARRDKARMALMFIDLDEFKPINDDLGHDVGDLLLQQVAQRLQECMRESDTAARIGGDEFLVLLPRIEAEQDALVVSEKIRLALYRPFEVGGETLRISSSIGIAIYPEHGSEERVLVKNADMAMYHAKKIGRNNVQIYRAGMQEIG
jgi:diguanylate cyclase (GGDEF)-like protein/PAS domain S-box-containing protein